jgi:hypothetical protein
VFDYVVDVLLCEIIIIILYTLARKQAEQAAEEYDAFLRRAKQADFSHIEAMNIIYRCGKNSFNFVIHCCVIDEALSVLV